MIAKSLIATMLVSGITFFTGCSMDKSDGMGSKNEAGMKSSMASANPKENVVVITGAHGGTASFVYDQASGKPKMTKMTGDMKECPSCMKNVEGYYMTGKMMDSCKDCGTRHMAVSAAHSGHG